MREDLNPWESESVQDSDLLDDQLSGVAGRNILEALQGARTAISESLNDQSTAERERDNAAACLDRARPCIEQARKARHQVSELVEGLLHRIEHLNPDGDSHASGIKDGLMDLRLALSEIDDETGNALDEMTSND